MIIAYRDYVQAATLTSPIDTSWQANAPLSNAQDRRLSVKAIRSVTGGFTLRATFVTGVEVGLIAILNHNFTSSGLVSVSILDPSNNNLYTALLLPVWYPPSTSHFPRNMFIVLPENITNVGRVELTIFSPGLGSSYGELGRFWAGPYFNPSYKAAHADFEIMARDDSVVSRSIGQQTYVDYRSRYRQLHCTIPAIAENDAIGIEAGTQPNMQDIAFEVGRGGEVIVIPSTANNQIIHKMGIYGHFLEPPSLRLATTNTSGRIYTSTFDVVEDL